MKKVLLAAILIAALILMTGCSTNRHAINAKIRYFDGTNEMVPVESYSVSGSFMRIKTLFGDILYVGANNVIIIEETQD